MNKLIVDYETYSDRSITDGYNNYFQTPNSRVLCLGWKYNDEPTQIWVPGLSKDLYPFKHMDMRDVEVYAHNAHFDYRCWNSLCTPHYGWPKLELKQVIDIMGICGRFTYPLGLDHVGKILKLITQKDKTGKALLKLNWADPIIYRNNIRALCRYCIQDVNAEYALLKALPSDILSSAEQRYWEDTVTVNENGLPIDIATVIQINQVLQSFIKSKSKVISKITGGRVRTGRQTAKIREFLADEGLELPNLQIATVEAALMKPIQSDKARALLELRAELSQSSIAKYKKLMELFHAPSGRVYDNLYYYKASTGRYAGRGFQAHNLPRAKVEDPELAIYKFFNYDILYEDPLTTAKALIRPCIKAPAGKSLIVVDYKSIENIGLLWAAGQSDLLENFKRGDDLYVIMASQLFNQPLTEIDKQKRFHGKTVELGAGYCLSGPGYVSYAASFGLTGLTEADGIHAIGIYRDSHYMVTKYWAGLNKASLSAVRGTPSSFRGVKFRLIRDRNQRLWLRMTLQSGRDLYYADPRIDDGIYGDIITHMGLLSSHNKWVRMDLTRGRITENNIQGVCRDILADAVHRLIKLGFKVICHIHDEIIIEVDEDKAEKLYPIVIDCMEDPPKWAKEFPIKTEGYIAKRYRKD